MLIYLLTLIDNEGDRQTFTAIYQEYHVQMEKVALRILSEHNDAEDAVQNAWIQVINFILGQSKMAAPKFICLNRLI